MEHDRRLRGIDEFIRAFEAEHGEITDAEMDEVARDMRARAIVVGDSDVIDAAVVLLAADDDSV